MPPSDDNPEGCSPCDGSDRPLVIRLFGSFEALVHGHPLPRLRTRKGQWLLALLVLRPSEELERDWLAGCLWAESPHARALANLRSSLQDLRRAMGPAAFRLRSPTRTTLTFDLDGTQVDVLAFDADVVHDEPAALRRAITLYRGPLLERCAEEWAFQERRVREQAYLQALAGLAAHSRAGGDLSAAELYLRRAVLVDPHRERTQRELMQVLAEQGSYAAALQVYRDLRLRLHQELNAAPDPQTQALFEQIRTAANGSVPVLPPESSRARRRAPGRGGNPPASPTSLLGRERELGTVRELLFGEAGRLVTLTGPAGTGKTRLALQAALEVQSGFPDGAFLVSLAPLQDPDLVVSTVAATLGVREKPDQPLIESLKQHLQEKQMLLFLDNFEHLLGAAPVVAELLAAAPRLRALVTSRSALRLRGEKLFPIPGLALPPLVDGRWLMVDGTATRRTGATAPAARTIKHQLSTINQYAAVRLFLERARDVQPGFALTEENLSAVAEICRRLDGLPLAIELAAARIRLLPPQAMLPRLERPLKLLTDGARDLPLRHQTLRDAIGWSHDLLSEQERRLFARLSVFAGGFTLESAEAICPGDAGYPELDLVSGLAHLVEKSLLRSEESGETAPRFLMLETILEFGREQLDDSGEMNCVRRRHAGHFRQLAETAEPELRGPDAALWFQRLETEQDNLRAALSYVTEREDVEIGLGLAGALAPFWRMRGHWAEGRQWTTQVLALPGAAARTPARAKALAGAALLIETQGDSEAVQALYGEGLEISRECGDRLRSARILEALGDLARGEGRISTAESLYEACLALYRELEDRPGQASLLMRLGLMGVEARGDWRQIRALLEQSRALYQEMGDSWGVAAPTIGLSSVAATQEKDVEKAQRYAEECLSIYRRLGAPERIAVALQQLARVIMDQKPERAWALLDEGIAVAGEIEDQPRVARLLCVQGLLARQQGDFQLAQARYEASLEIDRSPPTLTLLGQIAVRLRDYLTAETYFAEALSRQWDLLNRADASAVWRRFDYQADIARCLEGLAALAVAAGPSELAARLFGAAEALRDAIGDPLPPPDQAEHEERVAALRAAMQRRVFTRVWAEGRAMTLEQVIEHALRGLAGSKRTNPPAAGETCPR
jgi:predicted ATPase/DNA-binding SARP family transcriptional activator